MRKRKLTLKLLKYKYPISMTTANRIDITFRHKTPAMADAEERIVELSNMAIQFAELICGQTPSSREQSMALTKLEEAVMHAHSAITRNE